MRPLKQPVFTGTREVRGYFFAATTYDTQTAMMRILAMWAPGTRIYRTVEGLLILWPEAIRLASRAAPGFPLVPCSDFLSSAPLTKKERAQLQPPSGSVVLVVGGRTLIYRPDQNDEVDPVNWLDMDAFLPAQTEALGSVPDACPEISVVAEQESRTVSQVLDLFDPIAEQAEKAEIFGQSQTMATRPGFFSSLLNNTRLLFASAMELLSRKRPLPPVKPPPTGSVEPATAEPFWTGILARLFNLFRSRQSAGAAGASAEPPHLPPSRSFLKGLMFQLGLARLMGRRQAAYMRRMLNMFDKHDWDNALRHAIPIVGKDPPGPSSLGTLRPREGLEITNTPSASCINIGGPGLDFLTHIYRDAFQRLDRAGQIKQAAYVLAELLKEEDEAVDYLENKGLFAEAAGLAELRDMAPGLVIRLWFLSGDKDRALDFARRRGAFPDAIRRLEKDDPLLADNLRILWARALARAGDYLAAVDVVCKLESMNSIASAWLRRALPDSGQVGGILAMNRVIELLPELSPRVYASARALLAGDVYEDVQEREYLAALMIEEQVPHLHFLARPLTRSLAHDYGAGRSTLTLPKLMQIAGFADDRALLDDLEEMPDPLASIDCIPLKDRDPPLFFHFDGFGSAKLYDARFLADGRLLLALGEAGVQLRDRKNRQLAWFDVPAHHLVVSEHGRHVIALAERGKYRRLTRIDLDTSTAAHWSDSQTTIHADNYDGNLWFAVVDDELLAIDAQSDRFRALWRASDLPGKPRQLIRAGLKLGLLLDMPEGDPQVWLYDLPEIALRQREALPSPGGLYINELGTPVTLHHTETDASRISFDDGLMANLPGHEPQGEVAYRGNSMAIPLLVEEATVVYLLDVALRKSVLRIAFPDGPKVRLRLGDAHLTIAAANGFGVVVDLKRGQILRRFRT